LNLHCFFSLEKNIFYMPFFFSFYHRHCTIYSFDFLLQTIGYFILLDKNTTTKEHHKKRRRQGKRTRQKRIQSFFEWKFTFFKELFHCFFINTFFTNSTIFFLNHEAVVFVLLHHKKNKSLNINFGTKQIFAFT